jgi:hypothetical protein
MKKQGISDIISTILIILLTISATFVLSTFVIKFIKDQTGGQKICYDAKDQLSIDTTSGYTCVNRDISKTYVMIKRGNENVEIKKIIISVRSGGSAKSYTIENGVTLADVSMYNGDNTLVIPGLGASETYNFSGVTGSSAEIMMVLDNDKTCQAQDFKAELGDCENV